MFFPFPFVFLYKYIHIYIQQLICTPYSPFLFASCHGFLWRDKTEKNSFLELMCTQTKNILVYIYIYIYIYIYCGAVIVLKNVLMCTLPKNILIYIYIYIYIYMYIYILVRYWGAVIVLRNILGDLSSNPVGACLCFPPCYYSRKR